MIKITQMQTNIKIFNKKGDNINPQLFENISYRVEDTTGSGLQLKIWTNYLGTIIHVWIIDGGSNYTSPTIIFEDLENKEIFLTIPPDKITLGSNDEITSIDLNDPDNFDFNSQSFFLFTNYYLNKVSTGLIENETFYIIEEVWNQTLNKIDYTKWSVELLGPFDYTYYSVKNGRGIIEIENITLSCDGDKNDTILKVSSIPPSITIGKKLKGPGIQENTYVLGINTILNEIILNQPLTKNLNNTNIKFWTPHGLKQNTKVYLNNPFFSGTYEIDYVEDFIFSFPIEHKDIPKTNYNGTYFVYPEFECKLTGDEGFDLFKINYGEEYPEIIKYKSLKLVPDYHFPGDYSYRPNGTNRLRIISESQKKSELLPIHISFQSFDENIFVSSFTLTDTTFSWSNDLIFRAILEIETEEEEHRFGINLDNLGYSIDLEEEKLFRDSDINEDLVDYRLLNRKRKEMLLEGKNIWPYIGTYKSLFNILDFFGYKDIGVKEYFLNINENSEDFNKLKQITIRGEDKYLNKISINNKIYKKTNLLGLTFPIVKIGDNVDEYGIPETKDSFEFSIEEILIKLFGLKKFLKEKFLPLNTKIIDITGEGVYFTRFGINNWNNWNENYDISISERIEFNAPELLYIDFLNNPERSTKSPNPFKKLSNYTDRWEVESFTVLNPGGPFYSIPKLLLKSIDSSEFDFKPFMRGRATSSFSVTHSGIGYQVGDKITLGGGIYENPIVLIVEELDLDGFISKVSIKPGIYQGSKYRSIPDIYWDNYTQRPIGGKYKTINVTQKFTISKNEIPLEIEDIIWKKNSEKYAQIPQVEIINNVGGANIVPNVKKIDSYKTGQLSNFVDYSILDDPEQPVGARLNLSTEFNILLKDLTMTWEQLSNKQDAILKPWYLPAPAGVGELIAIEILNPGNGYTYNPEGIVDGDGYGAEFNISIFEGKVEIKKVVVSTVSDSSGIKDLITLTVPPQTIGFDKITAGKIVKGSGIPDGTIISSINYSSGQIFLQNYDGASVTTNIMPNDIIEIHEGVDVVTGGSGYTNISLSTNGGHTQTLHTIEKIGRRDFYQMQWIVKLTTPYSSNTEFFYDSGIGDIDDLIRHQVILPYTGKYTIELRLFDLMNNVSNLIKKDHTEVKQYLPNIISLSKWLTMPNLTLESKVRLNNIEGDFLNPELNTQKINVLNFPWNVIDYVDNEYKFLPAPEYKIIEVNQDEYLEGEVSEYLSATKTVKINGQKKFQKLNLSFDPLDWVYIVFNDNIFHLQITNIDYSISGKTKFDFVEEPPAIFKNSPKKWKIYRKLSNTIVIDDPKDEIRLDWITLEQNEDEIIYRIKNKNDSQGTIGLPSQPSNPIKNGEIGYIYRKRDFNPSNGNLLWNPNESLSSWVFSENIDNPTNSGRFIIRTTIGIDLLNEIRPGFTIISLFISYFDNLEERYDFRIVSAQLFTGNTGPYNIWNESVWILDVVSLNTGPLFSLNNYLLNKTSNHKIWLEYEYDIFLSKVRYNNNNNTEMYMEWDFYPPSENFVNFTINPSDELENKNYFYKSKYFFGEYSFKILNKGIWKGGQGTILRLDDPHSLLLNCDTNFIVKQHKFDKNWALERLGNSTPELKNLGHLRIDENPHISLQSNMFRNRVGSYGFDIVNILNPTIKLKFNGESTTINVGVSNIGYQFCKLFKELNNKFKNSWFYLFEYFLEYKPAHSNIFRIDTNESKKHLYVITNNTFSIDDTIYIPFLNDVFHIIDVITISSGSPFHYKIELDHEIELDWFLGTFESGSRIIKNIKFLSTDLEFGDSVSSPNLLPHPTQNLIDQIIIQNNKIVNIIVSNNATISGENYIYKNYSGETSNIIWIPANATANQIKIKARSIDNSVSSLGIVSSEGLEIDFNGTIKEEELNFHLGKFLNWVGHGRGQLGGYENDIYELLSEYPDLLTYFSTNPNIKNGFQKREYNFVEYKNISDNNIHKNYRESYYEQKWLPYIVRNEQWRISMTKIQENKFFSPIGIKHLFTAMGSRTTGKSRYIWRLYKDNILKLEVESKVLVFTFDEWGDWEIEVEVFDNRGNNIKNRCSISLFRDYKINIENLLENSEYTTIRDEKNIGPYNYSFDESFVNDEE